MKKCLVIFTTGFSFIFLKAQQLKEFVFDDTRPFTITALKLQTGPVPVLLSFFSLELDREKMDDNSSRFTELFSLKKLHLLISPDQNFKNGYKASLTFTNNGTLPVSISNIVPFGAGNDHYYISGQPLADTCRSYLFRPGLGPVQVIVPHNNNDLNFTAIELPGNKTLFGLLRRANDSIQNYLLNRSPYLLQPGKSISFNFYADVVDGDWHEALKKCFQEKKLYEVDKFDNRLYERKDLDYIRRSYTMHLMMAWDKDYYSATGTSYQLVPFLQRMKSLYGGDDIFTIWPTWPALGLDQRTQWRLMEDLPGGVQKQKELSRFVHSTGGKYFISYNPWDDSDEKRSLQQMSSLIGDIDADGVVLDTKAESSASLQLAADNAKPGIVLYSEGMAVPKDMQGIISGRVHNDIYYPPPLNLNKFIEPDFAIFRVVEVAKERVRREYSLALFNGHGVEINVMRPGRPEWIDDDYRYWGKCVRVLRESTGNFNSNAWTPLIPCLKDKIYVNKWPAQNKTVFTILSFLPEGFHDTLFEVSVGESQHLVDLWNHEEVKVVVMHGKQFATVNLDGFDQKYLGTNNEGSVGVMALFPKSLTVQTEGDKVSIHSSNSHAKKIEVWFGPPSYESTPLVFDSSSASFHLFEKFGRRQGKFIIQLFEQDNLVDEFILFIQPGTPLLVTEVPRLAPRNKTPKDMAKVPAGEFTMKVANGDEFIAYPKADYPKTLVMKSFYMDKYPVTNRQFKLFLDQSGYRPVDTVNFLRHWINGGPRRGEENFPVVNVSYEDAQAYAKWCGKRLPTEAEWQYAAQTRDGRTWPWTKSIKPTANAPKAISSTLTLVDYGVPGSGYCNQGNGKLYPVGKYTKGANPYGLQDLVGCVWQLTNDWYQSDTYQYIIMKGGSYYKPGGSWWYVQGGPKPLYYRQMLLRVSQGFERNATVGFRCAADAE